MFQKGQFNLLSWADRWADLISVGKLHSERLEQNQTIKYTVKDQSYIKSWQNHKNIFLQQNEKPRMMAEEKNQ